MKKDWNEMLREGITIGGTGDLNGAERILSEAKKLYPERPEIAFNLTVTYHGMKRFRDEIAELKRTLDIDTCNTCTFPVHINLSAAYTAMGRFDEALEEADIVIREAESYGQPEDVIARAHLCKAEAYVQKTTDMGGMDFSQAEAELNEAEKVFKDPRIEQMRSYILGLKRHGYIVPGDETIIPGVSTVKRFVPGEE